MKTLATLAILLALAACSSAPPPVSGPQGVDTAWRRTQIDGYIRR